MAALRTFGVRLTSNGSDPQQKPDPDPTLKKKSNVDLDLDQRVQKNRTSPIRTRIKIQ